MAKYLHTQAISNELTDLIRDAKEKIILVSYSFRFNQQIQEQIKTKSRLGSLSEIVIVYGNTKFSKQDVEWMKDIDDLKIYEKTNLHAKCYLNENRAIICSMNLYEYSQQNNIEMGILITKEQDKDAYENLLFEINNLKVNGNRKVINNLELIDFGLKGERIEPAEKMNSKDLSNQKSISCPAELTIDQKRKISIFKSYNAYKIWKVDDIAYPDTENKHIRVKLNLLDPNNMKFIRAEWYYTILLPPKKGDIITARLNKDWLNGYDDLED